MHLLGQGVAMWLLGCSGGLTVHWYVVAWTARLPGICYVVDRVI